MKCLKCQYDNPDGLKFCNECGQKLTISCPSCRATNQPNSKFCGECGHPLTIATEPLRKELTAEDKIAKIQKYLPAGITEKILSQREKIEGEKRQVTVMFCDMKGFTPLAEKLSPEEVYEIMDQVYDILIQKVQDYDGTVNEMTGDGIMALFGAPIALEDAPQRAIRAAMAIHREMTRFNEKLRQKRQDIPPLKMRAGIHTGPVVVGTLGNDLRVEFKAVGDTVNLAARMEQISEPGTTYVTDDTFKLTEGYFRFEALGEREIKGKERPLKVYQVIAPSTRRTRFDVSAERGLTPFVGRERELELLLDGYERAKEGRGQAVSVISDAGVGKSRLLYEFRKTIANEYATFLEGKCLSYSRNSAYHPVVDALKSNFEIQDNDTDQLIRAKVIRGLKTLKIDEAANLPYLLELLSVKESGIDKIPISPEAIRDRTMQALKRIVLNGSDIRPLVMAIEDLHWIDKSSEDALRQLLESISGSKIFLIFTYRPEYVLTWGSRSYHSHVTLNRLSNRESLAVAAHLLGTSNIDPELEELILQKTEGIPFFLEEFIKSLKELKAIERTGNIYQLSKDIRKFTIPSTIQDVIMARADNLPEQARDVLRTGSVIEREFSYDLIRKVTGLPEKELLTDLSILKDSELLFERGIYPESAYIFKHALTREVVYDSILTKRRKQIHAKIAKAMEELYGENICDCYGVLANHCMASEEYDKAAEYSRLEARKCQKGGSFKDAIEFAKRSIACLEQLQQNEVVQKRVIDARGVLSAYYQSLNHYIDAKNTVEPIINLALKLNYQKRLSGIYTAMGLYYLWIEEDYAMAKKYLNDVFAMAEEAGDFFALWSANFQWGSVLIFDYQFDESISCLEKASDLCVLSNNHAGLSHTKSVMSLNYNHQGRLDMALRMSIEALEFATKSGDVLALQPAIVARGLSYYHKGNLQAAEKDFLEGVGLYEKTSMASWGAYEAAYLGWVYLDMGEYGNAEEHWKRCVSIHTEAKYLPSWQNANKLCLAMTKILNHKSIDLNELNSLIASHGKNRLAVSESLGTRYIGEIYLHLGDKHMAEAETWIKRAIEFNTKHNTHWELARDYALFADWYKKKGDIEGAKGQLTKAIDLFEECGADGWVEMTKEKLAKLSISD
jgi:class 3 adenylate cyclase/AAA+ ATPase superfamily predicted ATPase